MNDFVSNNPNKPPIIINEVLHYWNGENYVKYKEPVRSEPLRVATFGDSTANIGTAPNSTNGYDFSKCTAASWQSGTVNYTWGANKYALDRYYPQAYLIFNGGISGDTVSGMLARDTSGVTATKEKSISNLIDQNIDVVLFRGGSINDLMGVVSTTVESVVNTVYANHITLLTRLTSAGIFVIDEGVFGAGTGMAATNLTETKRALVMLNAKLKAYAATNSLVTFLSPEGIVSDANGTFFANMSSDGTHLSASGMHLIARQEAQIITRLFGKSVGPRYRGVNIVTNSLMTTTTTDGAGVTASGFQFSIFNGTAANKKIEFIDGKVFNTAEVTITAANPSLVINIPYAPQSMNIQVGDIYGFEFDIYLESLTAEQLILASGYSRVDTRNAIGSGRVIMDVFTGVTGAVDKFSGHMTFPPILFGDVSANFTSASLFGISIALTNSSGKFKIGVAMPRIVKLTSL